MALTTRVAGLAALTLAATGIGLGIAAPGQAANDPAAPVIARELNTGSANPALTGSLTTELATDVALSAAADVATAAAAVGTGMNAADTSKTLIDTAASLPVYSSLTSAVAAQVRPDTVGEELACLAHATYYEAKGEPLEGQLAVAEVIVNRAESGRFADSLCGVVKQRGQFSFVRGGRIPEPNRASAAWREALAIALIARDEAWETSASDALFFHARRVAPGWRLKRVASLGNHIFYR